MSQEDQKTLRYTKMKWTLHTQAGRACRARVSAFGGTADPTAAPAQVAAFPPIISPPAHQHPTHQRRGERWLMFEMVMRMKVEEISSIMYSSPGEDL
jgi:hypothetical protein